MGKLFPVQDGHIGVPWAMMLKHEAQARRNHGNQSLETLARRGGLSLCEAVAVLEDRPWRLMETQAAYDRVKILVDDWSAGRSALNPEGER